MSIRVRDAEAPMARRPASAWGGWLSASAATVVVIHEEKRFAALSPWVRVSACSVDIVKRRRVLKGSTLRRELRGWVLSGAWRRRVHHPTD
jgi:hypothetical protein